MTPGTIHPLAALLARSAELLAPLPETARPGIYVRYDRAFRYEGSGQWTGRWAVSIDLDAPKEEEMLALRALLGRGLIWKKQFMEWRRAWSYTAEPMPGLLLTLSTEATPPTCTVEYVEEEIEVDEEVELEPAIKETRRVVRTIQRAKVRCDDDPSEVPA